VNVELIKDFRFEAAHSHPEAGELEGQVHGHSYEVSIGVVGPVASHSGWLLDFGDIKAAFSTLYDQLDHRYLNDVPGLDDVSVDGVSAWIGERLAPRLPHLDSVRVDILGDCMFKPVSVEANEDYGWPARVRFGFEAAHRLPNLPDTHKCRRLHGHSFHVEVGAEPLDGLETRLSALYEALDHRNLNEIPGLENATSENLCAWIWRRLTSEDVAPRIVIVQETCTARCVYRGE
jgi:6-pyruvoyltetrahydropterin/6-carboxytetrahydropterin synthase